MTINQLLTARRSPACHCSLCTARRASRLAIALQQKYSPALETSE